MADPLSVTASLVAIITAAVQSTKSLCATVSRFKGRDKTLQRLQNELQDTIAILDSLKEVVHTEASIPALLQGPIDRCDKVCREFEQSMESFNQKSKTGFRDWTKLEFMKGDINEFIDTISGYKSTISVGLGAITIRAAKVSKEALEGYNEMIQDTVYSLEIHLQRIDEKLASIDNPNILSSSVNLRNEKEVTEVCLRICEDAKGHLESLTKRESVLLQEPQNVTEDNEQDYFEAQLLTRQALDKNANSFAEIIGHLRNRLEFLVLKDDPGDGKERMRLVDYINTSKQCLEVCKAAKEVSSQKIYRVGEVIADGDSDQVVVTTLADLFDVKKALSKGKSAQLVGSMTEAALRHVTEKRYNSRFGAFAQESQSHQTVSKNSASNVESRKDNDAVPHQMGHVSQPHTSRMNDQAPSSNEVRKRTTWEEQGEPAW